MKRLSNKTKDKIVVIAFVCFLFFIAVCISLLFAFAINSIAKVNAEEITTELNGKEQMNKFYAEETIKAEIEYFASWAVIESMTEEEYAETFYKENQNV